MDNLSSRKIKCVADAINAVGAKVLYLPSYMNPIEMMWSKIKDYLREVKTRTKVLLEEKISNAIKRVTIKDICGWFRKNKYGI